MFFFKIIFETDRFPNEGHPQMSGNTLQRQHRKMPTDCSFFFFFLPSRNSAGLREHQTTPCQGVTLQAAIKEAVCSAVFQGVRLRVMF